MSKPLFFTTLLSGMLAMTLLQAAELKLIAGGSHGIIEKLIGGWQIASLGSLRSNWFSLYDSSNPMFPTGTPVQDYGYKYPIQDCRSGLCYPGYLYWNGYIPANQINSHDAGNSSARA